MRFQLLVYLGDVIGFSRFGGGGRGLNEVGVALLSSS